METEHQLRLIPRLYESSDAETLDRLLDNNKGHDVRLDRDRVVVVGPPSRPVGLLCWRPGGIVHELFTGHGLAQRSLADLLVRYAMDDAVSKPFHLHEAIFITDSEAMARYADELGAIEEAGKRVFTLDLRRKP